MSSFLAALLRQEEIFGSPHTDILATTPPGDTHQLLQLCEELKSRGNLEVAAGNYRAAEVLYSRGLVLLQSPSAFAPGEKAAGLDRIQVTLLSNRSMVRAKMGDKEGTLTDAQACVKLDRRFVKGHFRLGHAQLLSGRACDAVQAFEVALELLPGKGVGRQEIQRALDRAQVALWSDTTNPIASRADFERLLARVQTEDELLGLLRRLKVSFGGPTLRAGRDRSSSGLRGKVGKSELVAAMRGVRARLDAAARPKQAAPRPQTAAAGGGGGGEQKVPSVGVGGPASEGKEHPFVWSKECAREFGRVLQSLNRQ
eukprot:g5006.t1